MKKVLAFALALSMGFSSFATEAVTPERQKLAEELITVLDMKTQLEASFDLLRGSQMQTMAKALEQQGVPQTAEQKENQKKTMDAVISIFKEEMNWEKVRPIYANIYASTFTDQELKDLTAFFKTPVGKAFASKSPELQKKTAEGLQSIILSATKRISVEIVNQAAGKK
jgi:hypothetical protein